ncbi:outer membrane protein [Mangrovibrevibacter kandeliae]|uniref:outer membrane protein n=1 Tax=Mangrovibrevibacter kandeliae TaxID=2968473 RepID=UPI002118FB20|nr:MULTISPECIES: outer membrane protein [unclassified Aurantimonas]MCQ8780846.1 porin family protein [Aurantimonas sp. CSK15Z-1]MCW4113626.1 porin family protein [Aurantimonas sp. MSK8Z-1]
MNRFALLLASTAFVTPALAADVVYDEPPAPSVEMVAPASPMWSGFYVGGQAGVAFNGDNSNNFDFGGAGVVDDAFGGGDDAGFIGGVHAGYDYQINNFVIGAVVDANYIDAERNQGFTTGGATYNTQQEIDFLGTARLRAGVAFSNLLVYGTGGLAYASLDTKHSDVPAGADVHDDDNDFGYAVGGGIDYLVTPNISIGAEYLYTNLGSNKVEFEDLPGTGGATVDARSDDDFDFHTVWAKASYRFN